MQIGVNLCIFFWGITVYIIFREFFCDTGRLREICSFVVCNGGLLLRGVGPDFVVSVDVDEDLVFFDIVLRDLKNTVVAIDDDDIGIPVIRIVSVGKLIVPARNGIGLDTVSCEDRVLHSIVIDKEMTVPLLNFVAGIVEQIVNIKFQFQRGREKIAEISFAQINRVFTIQTVTAEVQQNDRFVVGEPAAIGKQGVDGNGSVR